MSDKGMDRAVEVECAPQQQTVFPPQLRNHHSDQTAGEGLQTHGHCDVNINRGLGGNGRKRILVFHAFYHCILMILTALMWLKVWNVFALEVHELGLGLDRGRVIS